LLLQTWGFVSRPSLLKIGLASSNSLCYNAQSIAQAGAQMWLCDANLHFIVALAPFEFGLATLALLSIK
ncbi:hypothetical protein HAX54_019149, partial [Datura stramonium]|nr:hypothetical protein [Datura stramonium]